ncbi:Uma2 family endonuclease [Leptothoe kymatousa]|uniref:Uma2 family endonuclease n=1 Tax=Leptothoe kymatousa TAU-MAC 1615 TaxID=2364775 RepID=A0ABS5XZ35_9CYAN|nr:Uma2 family endonuclease [Leptothoe kymatousa]MBT9310865.1 Uma2 family endonuclease [Leptothoe kymatousa TAU-MAC 1615]
MTYTPTKLLTFDSFIKQYGTQTRYELADGELIDMEPTGPHETVAGKLTSKLNIEIDKQQLPWVIPTRAIVRPFANIATARRPDLVVLDELALAQEPLWQREPVITVASSIKLVVEVVSTNWETDYARKVEEYSLFGISEYWIVDFLGLGGIAFIGRPKQPTITVCQLVDDEYEQRQFRLGERIISQTFPGLELQLSDVLPR